jgi:hypothetical protein
LTLSRQRRSRLLILRLEESSLIRKVLIAVAAREIESGCKDDGGLKFEFRNEFSPEGLFAQPLSILGMEFLAKSAIGF